MDNTRLPGASSGPCMRCYATAKGYAVHVPSVDPPDAAPHIFPSLAAAMAFAYAVSFVVTPSA